METEVIIKIAEGVSGLIVCSVCHNLVHFYIFNMGHGKEDWQCPICNIIQTFKTR